MTLPMIRRPQARVTRRWDPFTELEGLYDEMGQLMQRVTGELPAAPPTDIEETDDAFIVELDVPGARREDIDVEVRENQLHVSGEIKERERTGVWRRKSRVKGEFDFVIGLPGEVDPENVEAGLHDGVLSVRLGKAARARPRHIEIKT
jgi:HSP20 family protein